MTWRSGLDVSAVHVRIPLRQPFASATGRWRDHDAWLVQLREADGRVGIGEATLGPGASAAELSHLGERIRALAAEPASEAEVIDGPLGWVIGAARIDAGWPGVLATTVARRTAVVVNGTIGVESTAASVGCALEMVAAGFGTLKLKVGSEGSTDELATRVGLVRQAVGPRVALRLDANGAWAGAVARQRLEALAAFDLEYVEQPLAVGPPGEMARLRADVPVPIAADESLSDEQAAQALVDAEAADVLVVKPARVGAAAVCLRIAQLAEAAGVGVVISTLLETGVGIGAALGVAALLPASAREYAHGLATAGLLESDLLLEPLAIVGGRMSVPVGSSVVGRLDRDAVRRYAVEWVGEPW